VKACGEFVAVLHQADALAALDTVWGDKFDFVAARNFLNHSSSFGGPSQSPTGVNWLDCLVAEINSNGLVTTKIGSSGHSGSSRVFVNASH